MGMKTFPNTDLGYQVNLTGPVEESLTASATAATGTINYDLLGNKNVLYYTTAATGNWTLNLRGNSSTLLNSLMYVGQVLTVVFMVTNGTTAYYQTGLQIDGVSVTPKWQGGAAPAAGNASSVDIYTITIVKNAENTYTVLEQLTKFA